MTKPISAAAASSIEAAISRLMGSGDVQATFTIARLASEAGLLARDTLQGARIARELPARRRVASSRGEESTVPHRSRPPARSRDCRLARSRDRRASRPLRSSNRSMAQHIQALSLLVRQQQQRIAGFRPNRRNRDALQRSSRLPRRGRDEFFLARIARAGSGSHGPTE